MSTQIGRCAARKMAAAMLLSVIMLLTSCGERLTPAVEPSITPAPPGMIVLGDISDDPAKKIERFQPLADYLAAHLGDFGIATGMVKIAPDLKTMTSWMADGQVDLYFDSPYPAMIVMDGSGAQPLLRRWKGGVAEYHTIILAQVDTGIYSLNDLPGHMIGFEDNYSTTGFFLPAAYLKEAGMTLAEKSDLGAPVAQTEVGYVFTGDDENTLESLLSGKIAAGAVDSTIYAELPAETRALLIVLAETETLPRHIALLRSGVDPGLTKAIKALLTGLEVTPDGEAILQKFEKTTRFDEFPGGVESTMTRMRELYRIVYGN